MNLLFSPTPYLLALFSIALFGCSDAPQEKMLRQAVAIESADECHLCGMIISNFPGPKGESYQSTGEHISKFCSTRDLFAFLLQPENVTQAREVFVHDMSQSPWHKPNDEYFIDARTAWYVVGSNQKGAMGMTLASFAKQDDATSFSNKFGGEVYAFDDITIELIMN
ncbi:nitrous oxide reductase accessory protein NosL [Vibrio sp. ZSDE26]|uniref:Nitrous oxide reductase accessory protein NosL n=1 Tax=Vibrio amylolyticus TaxID=2847292 RepID=A0A9X1XMA9_9VIBR|nr:nitrous oxide reductase accessory protein NosL [Vibrio amylolyticus]MCK6265424.1 nitrous oxide reductase accessory protein NosL [Vibrio amylolyticus]